MKKLFVIILIIISYKVYSQDSLKSFALTRNTITTNGMKVLGSWAIANIGVGVAGWANSQGGSNKSFYQMTTIWGAVNLGAAILGYTNVQKNKNNLLTPVQNLREQQKIEKIFLINAGLDFVYIGAGAYMLHRGNVNRFNELRGYGSSIIIEGVFLLLFDGTMYTSQKINGNKLTRFLKKNPIAFNGTTIGITYRL